MGGPGSGNRCHYGAKSLTDDYRSLDVRRWAREGMLRPGYCGQLAVDAQRRSVGVNTDAR